MKVYIVFKNIFDFILAFLGIIIFAPLLLVCAIAIKLEDGGAVFFSQRRTGKNMRLFKCYKFRTMHTTDVVFDKDAPVIKNCNKNLTRVGRILRKFKLDELPQLFNILKGDMYFIAPRPLLPEYEEDYEEWEKIKFRVRPGMTGLGQVNGNGHLSIKDRNYYDVKYVMEMSILKDIGIFFKTFLVILFGEQRFVNKVSFEDAALLKKRAIAKLDKEKAELHRLSLINSINIESEV